MKKFFKFIAVVSAVALTVGIGFYLYLFILGNNAIFDADKLVRAEKGITILDSVGNAALDVSTSKYETVEIETLPDYVKNAFIAVEDKRFYSHNGLDYLRMAKAAFNNITSFSLKEGASTISQQLVKNTHLSNEKTFKRKAKEIALTRQLEKQLTKEEILESYLNTIYFGQNSYGIERAAKTYFSKSAVDLSVSEAATLAAVVKAPSVYSPLANLDKATDRRNLVLSLMLDNRFISDNQYETAKTEKIVLNSDATDNFHSYAARVVDELEQVLENSAYGVYSGLTVFTALDKNVQTELEKDSDSYSLDCDRTVSVVDNQSNSVIAYFSSVGNARRNPASTVKPWLVYAPAIQEKIISPSTKILDEKTSFGGYSPKNYGDKYFGYVSARHALAHSLNVPAVKTLEYVGVDKALNYAEKMNIRTTNKSLGLALGGFDDGLTVIENAACFTTLANGGSFTENKFINKIVNSNGKTIYERKIKRETVFSPETAFLVCDMLLDATTSGTARKLGALGFPVYGKTGTNGESAGNSDAYCFSFTDRYTVGVWLGNADNSLMPNTITGGGYPSVIASDVLGFLHHDVKPFAIPAPSGVVSVKLDKLSYDEKHLLALAPEDAEFFKDWFLSDCVPKQAAEIKFNVAVENFRVENNSVIFDAIPNRADKFAVFRESKGKKIVVFVSEEKQVPSTISDRVDYGVHYTYSIVPVLQSTNGEEVFGEPFFVKNIKIKKRDLNDSDWWNK